MPRKPQFTDDQIITAMREHKGVVQDAAAALHISRQALLAYRKKPTIVAALGLPAPTPEEQANKERARERKAELTTKARAPDLDEITDWVIKAATALKEIDKVRNVSAATIAQLRQENERLKGRLALLDKAEEQKRAFKLAVDQDGEISPIRT